MGLSRKLLRGMAAAIVALLGAHSLAASLPLDNDAMAAAWKTGDSMFTQPYIDIDEWRQQPVRHRYIHGGFKDTDTRFSIYFPSEKQYQGRFFQHITPVPGSENLAQESAVGTEDKIGFAIASGGYFLETNGGGPGFMVPGADPSIAAYRANAAAAQYSRVVAADMYGQHRSYGYAYGGSGGGFRTIGGIENTEGVWDGVVPYVIGSPMSIPNVFTVRMHAMRILQDKFPAIVDALEPGGGDMYAGLNEEERAALTEVTRMGFPPRAWFGYKTMGQHAFPILFQGVVQADPAYFEEFWTVPGYLGAEPTESLLRARILHTTTVVKMVTADEVMPLGRLPGQARGGVDTAFKQAGRQGEARSPVGFQLAGVPAGDLEGASLIVSNGAAAGKSHFLRATDGDVVLLGPGSTGALSGVEPGDEVRIDNAKYLAAQTYHRHQVPTADFEVWDQFRGADGKPLYPQRPMLLGPLFAKMAAGTVQSGQFKGKMIVVESLMDREAFPWQADWYRSRVRAALGSGLDDHFRLWFVDHALHGDDLRQEDPTRTVSYLGVLHQALRDLSAWVEKGVAPPASTEYEVVDGQVLVPPTAAARKGVQAVVSLKANGGDSAEISSGTPVEFTATIELPPGAGSVVGAEWDFEGAGDYPVKQEPGEDGSSKLRVNLTSSYTFSRPGTYFPALRVSSQRQGDAKTPYARIQNLGRVRVVVK